MTPVPRVVPTPPTAVLMTQSRPVIATTAPRFLDSSEAGQMGLCRAATPTNESVRAVVSGEFAPASCESSLPFSGSTPTQHSLPDDVFVLEDTPEYVNEVNISP